jgi:hypothetical protein
VSTFSFSWKVTPLIPQRGAQCAACRTALSYVSFRRIADISNAIAT